MTRIITSSPGQHRAGLGSWVAAVMTRTQVAAAVLAAGLAIASAIVPLISGLGPPLLLVRSASGVVFMAAGVAAWMRNASARLGWLFLLAGSAMCAINATLSPGPVLSTLRVLTGGYALFGVLLVHLLFAYPGGRVSRKLDRLLVGYVYVITGIYIAGQYLIGDAEGRRPCAPVGCDSIGPAPIASARAAGAVPVFMLIAFSVGLVILVVTLTHRWIVSTPAGRRVMRPVLFSLVATVGLATTSGAVRLGVLPSAGFVRVGIAVGWGLTVSAIAVGLLIGILRNQLILGSLVSQIDTAGPLGDLRHVLVRLLGDPSVQLLRVATDRPGFVDADGAVLHPGQSGRTWLLIGDPPAGAVIYDDAAQPDPVVVQAVVGALRLVLDNARLQDRLREQLIEVEASRARILKASDVQRRRIERDLHDGAQQHLVTSALTVNRARHKLRLDPDEADRLLAATEDQLRSALREIRDLARGLHPPILSEEGIGAAVESLAARLPLHVVLRDDLSQRYPFLVETTAYFVVSECLVNVVKYAEVDCARVSLSERAGRLDVEVADDGRGGADPARGSGLDGLADRVAAVGGTLVVDSPPGVGTAVRVSLAGARGSLSGAERRELT